MISIVIPAHNEEQVIGRCLAAILADAGPGELDIVVVTNGCTDRTAEVAASYPNVRVVDSPKASKPAALTLGDQVAHTFPRMYIDADVEVGTAAIRAVGDALESGDYDLAAPTLHVELRGRPWALRAYYDVWTRLPYARDNLVGAGFYGLSARAHSFFEAFPDTMAEDFFIYSLVGPERRKAVAEHTFVIHPPLDLRSLLKIQTRIHAANVRNRDLYSSAAEEVQSNHLKELAKLVRQPRLAPKVAVYLAVVTLAKVRAARLNRKAATPVWDRDDSARAASAGRHA